MKYLLASLIAAGLMGGVSLAQVSKNDVGDHRASPSSQKDDRNIDRSHCKSASAWISCPSDCPTCGG